MSAMTDFDEPHLVPWFEKHYVCSECSTKWKDEWSCMCNDRCPGCNAETEPTYCTDLSRSLTSDDYRSAAHYITGLLHADGHEITDKDAIEFAQAKMEGGIHRFRS